MTTRSGSTRSRAEDLAQKARFVFRGTVQRTEDATMATVPVTDRTTVVRVDEVIQAPEALAGYAGQDITVQLSGRGKVTPGQQAVFYTNPWLFGDSIAVQGIGHQAVTGQGARAILSGAGADPVQTLADRDLQVRFAEADLVIVGKVASVRLPPEAATAAGASSSYRVDEHDPMWREAVIDVTSVEKGEAVPPTVVVRFPSSTDVRWYESPKFAPGDEGVFILRRREILARTAAPATPGVAAEPARTEAFTALRPSDFQPLSALPNIRAILATSSGGTG